jgi:hypothetical protein
MEFLGNLLKLVAWGKLGDLHPRTQGDEPKRVARAFEKFAANGFYFPRLIIPIDRAKPFSSHTFIGVGWGIQEQETRSLKLAEVDLTDVHLKTVFDTRPGARMSCATHLLRLRKTTDVQLDAKVFQMLWENPALIPERWKEKTNGKITLVFFEGTTILRHSNNDQYVLFLFWDGGAWKWNVYWLGDEWRDNHFSAVVEGDIAA